MTMIKQYSQVIIIVLLANHTDRQHIYHFQPDQPLEAALETVAQIQGNIDAVLSNRKGSITFQHPLATYRAEHIIGFEITVHGQEQIAQRIEELSRAAGSATE